MSLSRVSNTSLSSDGEKSKSLQRSSGLPGMPLSLSAAPTSLPGEISLSWSAPSDSGESAITSYKIYHSSGPTTVAGTSTTLKGLTTGSSLSFYVVAINSLGEGVPTNSVSATPVEPISATGGTVSTYSSGGVNYKVHTFNSTSTLSVSTGGSARAYVIGGGGNGGCCAGGGGGGGRAIEQDITITVGSHTVTVAGGTGTSSVGSFASSTGGSGGGSTGGNGGASNFSGGRGFGGGNYNEYGGGGGGAGGSGSRNGGIGLTTGLSGSNQRHGGGGGGGGSRDSGAGVGTDGGGNGGRGGGGGGGAANRGSGGGGGGWQNGNHGGGGGGSGKVIIRYPTSTS